ncbi:UNKNOWN [Stylonychia lemnae]|uniref:Transmembrane protein n=1 Tax=Stylonychia lemnae TaxID=5949 RepID=A0A078ACV6_STYLE|nr:UNKNOWN [Stylonychia lemnae]|eukprot:CDW80039.1 UNKNOWN [Stylonychia lemnae]
MKSRYISLATVVSVIAFINAQSSEVIQQQIIPQQQCDSKCRSSCVSSGLKDTCLTQCGCNTLSQDLMVTFAKQQNCQKDCKSTCVGDQMTNQEMIKCQVDCHNGCSQVCQYICDINDLGQECNQNCIIQLPAAEQVRQLEQVQSAENTQVFEKLQEGLYEYQGLLIIGSVAIIVALAIYKFRECYPKEVETDYQWYGKNDDTRQTVYKKVFGENFSNDNTQVINKSPRKYDEGFVRIL